MDFSESTKEVYNRIHKLEPNNVSKIIGYLLLGDHGEREMIRLAHGPDNMIHSLINQAKSDLGLSPKIQSPSPISPPQMVPTPISDFPLQFTPFSPSSSRPFSSPANLRSQNPYWDLRVPADQSPNLDFVTNYADIATDDSHHLHNQLQFLSLEDHFDPVNTMGGYEFSSNYYFQEPALGPRTSRRSPSLPEFPVKVCHYFSKGFCKHGSNCRYFHGNPMAEGFAHSFNPNSNEIINEDMFSPGSLEKLEVELAELLKSKRGPVSIASLPLMYFEKYGRNLQAEGYLTESQRHGKAGYSLTKLLARLKNSIRLIDSYRPHGQHSVTLVDDVSKYMEPSGGDKNEHGGIVAGSRQIYLTFPAESTFTEQDVSNYFSKFGPVQDVRLSCQQHRMFGFVTFVYVETVKQILTKGNPHFVCDARVLVKPYREKPKLVDRKFEKVNVVYASQFLDANSEDSMSGISENPRLLKQQFVEDHELEKRRFSELESGAKPPSHHSYFGYSLDELKRSEAHTEQTEFLSTERYHYFLDALNNCSTGDENGIRHINTKYNDQESNQGLNLPDSPFASPIGSGLSTVT